MTVNSVEPTMSGEVKAFNTTSGGMHRNVRRVSVSNVLYRRLLWSLRLNEKLYAARSPMFLASVGLLRVSSQ